MKFSSTDKMIKFMMIKYSVCENLVAKHITKRVFDLSSDEPLQDKRPACGTQIGR